MALSRISQAIRNNVPANFMDMYGSVVTVRLGDSLYVDISSITAAHLVNKFFQNKKVTSFDEGLPGDAVMIYSENGKQDTTHVDVWLQRAMGGPEIRALNISNYPLATVFFNTHKGD